MSIDSGHVTFRELWRYARADRARLARFWVIMAALSLCVLGLAAAAVTVALEVVRALGG